MKTQPIAQQKSLQQILVTIIIPVYNVELYIEDCLQSVIEQTHTNLEILIVEDCSTDHSKLKLLPYLNDKRINFIEHDQNRGLSAARNTGINAATGEYIMFVDSDDMIHPELVATCVEAAVEKQTDMITYQFATFEEDKNLQDLKQQASFIDFTKNSPATPNYPEYFTLPHFAWLKFIKTSLIKAHALQFPVDLYYEDWPFHWQAGIVTQNTYHLPIKAYLYRQRSSSITGSTGNKLLDLFKIHRLVIDLIETYHKPELKIYLANKVKQSHWVILTRIDGQYLADALAAAQQDEALLIKHDYPFDNHLTNNLVTALTRSPTAMAMTSLIAIRKSLKLRRALSHSLDLHLLPPLSPILPIGSLGKRLISILNKKNKFRKRNVSL